MQTNKVLEEFDERFVIEKNGDKVVKPRDDEDDGDGGLWRAETIHAFLLEKTTEARSEEKGLWRLAITHLNMAERESVLATYEKLKEHMAAKGEEPKV